VVRENAASVVKKAASLVEKQVHNDTIELQGTSITNVHPIEVLTGDVTQHDGFFSKQAAGW